MSGWEQGEGDNWQSSDERGVITDQGRGAWDWTQDAAAAGVSL